MPAIVIIMSLVTGLEILDEGRHDPDRLFVEVYDDPQPTTEFGVPAVKALAAWDRVIHMKLGRCNRCEDHVDLVQQPGASLGQV
jgi:hypothetical protein